MHRRLGPKPARPWQQTIIPSSHASSNGSTVRGPPCPYRTDGEQHSRSSFEARLRRPWRDKFRPRLWHYRQYGPAVLRVPATYAAQAAPENAPRIAIVTPSYNHARYLRTTIDSVLAQNYPNLAYVVEDGGSTDGTRQLLESYGNKLALAERAGHRPGQCHQSRSSPVSTARSWPTSIVTTFCCRARSLM